jgi:RNA-directed DNA polymerase
MNEFDQFVKHELMIKSYARYTDDFIIVSDSKLYLEQLVLIIREVLRDCLRLSLHPEKVTIQPYHRGVDFLGYIIFPHHRLMRVRTRKRMLKKIERRVEEYNQGLITEYLLNQSLQSYLGALSHANTYKLSQDLRNRFWL